MFIASALLNYCETEELAFFCMCYFMVTLNWREHFIEPYTRSKNMIQEQCNFIVLSLPELNQCFQQDGEGMLFATMKTLYDYLISNCSFSGEKSGLPIEISRRVFEFVVFDGVGDSSLSNIIILMLIICKDRVC